MLEYSEPLIQHDSGFLARKRDKATHSRGEYDYARMKAEIGVMHPCTKEHLRLQESERGKEKSQKLWREHDPDNTLILNFQPPELWDNKCLLLKATQFVVLCYNNLKETNIDALAWFSRFK